jgi:5-amino-6-(5-phosphoribosylamino)uracil reductase
VDRPYVLLSCATSLDGYLDDASSERLILSSAADLDRVDELRAGSDAILIGAGTIRADNPRLLLRSPARREARVARGATPYPLKITLTSTGDLDPAARFFTAPDSGRLVYVASGALASASQQLDAVAEVTDAGQPVRLARVLADLASRGIARLMVEGGSSVLTQFLAQGLADELQLTIAPFFVGDSRAPRFVGTGAFANHSDNPARLVQVTQAGTDAVLRYALSERFSN